MRDRITGHAIGSTLEQNELRSRSLEKGFDLGPDRPKVVVAGSGRHWKIQFGPHRSFSTGLIGMAGTRVEITAILMNICEEQVRIGFERLINPVTMMSVDIDIRDAAQVIARPQ